jgi:hypothetical protein
MANEMITSKTWQSSKNISFDDLTQESKEKGRQSNLKSLSPGLQIKAYAF